jgi:hypothetical protein
VLLDPAEFVAVTVNVVVAETCTIWEEAGVGDTVPVPVHAYVVGAFVQFAVKVTDVVAAMVDGVAVRVQTGTLGAGAAAALQVSVGAAGVPPKVQLAHEPEGSRTDKPTASAGATAASGVNAIEARRMPLIWLRYICVSIGKGLARISVLWVRDMSWRKPVGTSDVERHCAGVRRKQPQTGNDRHGRADARYLTDHYGNLPNGPKRAVPNQVLQ